MLEKTRPEKDAPYSLCLSLSTYSSFQRECRPAAAGFCIASGLTSFEEQKKNMRGKKIPGQIIIETVFGDIARLRKN